MHVEPESQDGKKHERFKNAWRAAQLHPMQTQNWDYFWCMHVSADFRNPQRCKINVNLCGKGQNWEEHELSLSVDWENTPRRVLMSIATCWTPNRLLYTNGRFIPGLTWQLGAHFHSWHLRPAHMVSSQMTRGYPVEPTVASEPSQLLKPQVCLRSTAQASLGPKM